MSRDDDWRAPGWFGVVMRPTLWVIAISDDQPEGVYNLGAVASHEAAIGNADSAPDRDNSLREGTVRGLGGEE